MHNERCTPGSEGGGRKPVGASPPWRRLPTLHNPLNLVDPSGFQPNGQDTVPFEHVYIKEWPNGDIGLVGVLPPRDPPEKEPPGEEQDEGEKVGAYVPPVDVSPTGNTATYDPQPVTTAAEDWSRGIAAAELSLGFGIGALTGLVPGGAVAEQIGTTIGLEKGWIEPHPDLQLGIALGQIFGGLARVVQGGLMIKGGAALSATGVGAIAGVPAIAVGAAWAAAGGASVLAGLHGLMSLSTGSGSGGPVHHIMTNKNHISTAAGGPWTPQFEKMARRAGMTLEDVANKVAIPGHRGPHPEAYHREVFRRLQDATRGLSGDAYSSAFRTALEAIRVEVSTAGTYLNKLVAP